MIPFNMPCVTGDEIKYISQALQHNKISGDGFFTNKCTVWFEENLNVNKVLLTPSCTHALEIAAILLDLKTGDEIIMPSYTFVSTANAFALRGASIVFVDIRPDTLNIDETKIEAAITDKTKAIVPVHYAGVACEMDAIMDIAKKHNLYVIEDAAQGMMSTYNGKALGTIGHLGTYSFHETKNYTSGGEGGLLIINDERFVKRSEIIREKGTNRSQFFRKEIDKYSWVDIGSSYLLNDISAAYLYAQLLHADLINKDRKKSWNLYYQSLQPLEKNGYIELPRIPENVSHNNHIFYIKTQTSSLRDTLLQYLRANGIEAVFHYVPLHSSKAGKNFGRFHADDEYTTQQSSCLIRLPLFYKLEEKNILKIYKTIEEFFAKKRSEAA